MERRKRYIAAQARIFKALGHPSRLLHVDALREGEKCVCELQALVGDDYVHHLQAPGRVARGGLSYPRKSEGPASITV